MIRDSYEGESLFGWFELATKWDPRKAGLQQLTDIDDGNARHETSAF